MGYYMAEWSMWTMWGITGPSVVCGVCGYYRGEWSMWSTLSLTGLSGVCEVWRWWVESVKYAGYDRAEWSVWGMTGMSGVGTSLLVEGVQGLLQQAQLLHLHNSLRKSYISDENHLYQNMFNSYQLPCCFNVIVRFRITNLNIWGVFNYKISCNS
jgi:hypothetical protein